MDWNAEIETDGNLLKRIVALLFALAGLAERASGRSYPVRCFVLWLLRRAEVAARNCIDEDMQPAPIAVVHRNSSAEALYLARLFRWVARALKRELRLQRRFARRWKDGLAVSEPESPVPPSSKRLDAALRDPFGLAFVTLRLGASCRGPPPPSQVRKLCIL